MKSKLWTLLLLAWAGTSYANYPTLWKIENPGTEAVTVVCEMPSPAGLSSPIRLPALLVAPGQTLEYCWSNWWHNDGMGLNPGFWQCTYNGQRADRGFSTTWGEDILLNTVSGFKRRLPSGSENICY